MKRFNTHTPESLIIPTGTPSDFQPTPEEGLSSAEAAAREKAGKGNRAKDTASRSVLDILASNLFTFFNFLNIALALCLVSVHSYRNMLFLGVVISNTVIGTVQELRARRTVQRLQLMQPSEITCIRDGKEVLLRPESLVEGDRVILHRGDQIPADGIVLSGNGAADESMLTGESHDIVKHAGEWVLSGTFVTQGQLTIQLVQVGNNSYAARLTEIARKIHRPKSALMTDLTRLTHVLSMILVPMGILLFCRQYFMQGRPLDTAVPQAVAAMVGMIPEGLILLTSVALAVGVVRLGRKGALVQELYGIETLSRADILCLDKTGTLTTGRMSLDRMVPVDGTEEELKEALARMLAAFPEDDTPTMTAIRSSLTPSMLRPEGVLPFSSERKCSAACFGGNVLILGAPSFVLRDQYTGTIRETCETFASEGCRVILLAEGSGWTDGVLPPVRRVLGLVLLLDEIRPEASSTLAYFHEQGVEVKIISGDDPRTVKATAAQVGLDGEWVDTSTLSDEDLPEAALRCTIFGRVTPERKRQLVKAMQAQGHHVAMTGDGVNDIPAMKAADCSIAMASGADAARKAAQLTLVNSDFSVLPDVVGEGRRVVNNITRSASLFLIKTLYSFALTLLLIFLPAVYPFQPIQLTVVSTFTIGIPAFFLSLEANHDRIRGNFLMTILKKAAPGALCVTLCAVFSMIMENFGWSAEMGSTLSTLSAAGVGLLSLLYVSWPLNLYRGVLIAVMAGCLTCAFVFFGHVFFLVRLSTVQYLILAGLLLLSAVIIGVHHAWLSKHHKD